MESSTSPSATPPEAQVFSSDHPRLLQRLWRDPVLLGACLVFGLLAGFQLEIHLAQPPWIGAVNDWLLFVLAWLETLVLVGLSGWFTRTQRPEGL